MSGYDNMSMIRQVRKEFQKETNKDRYNGHRIAFVFFLIASISFALLFLGFEVIGRVGVYVSILGAFISLITPGERLPNIERLWARKSKGSISIVESDRKREKGTGLFSEQRDKTWKSKSDE